MADTPVEDIRIGDVIAWFGKKVTVLGFTHRYSRYDDLEAVVLDVKDGDRTMTWTKFPGDSLSLCSKDA